MTTALQKGVDDAQALLGDIAQLLQHVDAFITYGDSAVALALSENTFVTTKSQINRVIAQVATIRAAMFTEASNDALDRIVELVDKEQSILAVEWRVSPIAKADLQRALLREHIVGTRFQEWVSAAQANDYQLIRSRLRMGYASGRTSLEVLQSIKGTQRQAYRDGVLIKTKRSVDTLVASATNMLMNWARLELMRRAGVQHWQLAVIPDGNASDETQEQDGQVFAIGEGPSLPLHPNGRSLAVPVTA